MLQNIPVPVTNIFHQFALTITTKYQCDVPGLEAMVYDMASLSMYAVSMLHFGSTVNCALPAAPYLLNIYEEKILFFFQLPLLFTNITKQH